MNRPPAEMRCCDHPSPTESNEHEVCANCGVVQGPLFGDAIFNAPLFHAVDDTFLTETAARNGIGSSVLAAAFRLLRDPLAKKELQNADTAKVRQVHAYAFFAALHNEGSIWGPRSAALMCGVKPQHLWQLHKVLFPLLKHGDEKTSLAHHLTRPSSFLRPLLEASKVGTHLIQKLKSVAQRADAFSRKVNSDPKIIMLLFLIESGFFSRRDKLALRASGPGSPSTLYRLRKKWKVFCACKGPI